MFHPFDPPRGEFSSFPAETRWYARAEGVEASRLVRPPRGARWPPWRILLRALTSKRPAP